MHLRGIAPHHQPSIPSALSTPPARRYTATDKEDERQVGEPSKVWQSFPLLATAAAPPIRGRLCHLWRNSSIGLVTLTPHV